MAPVHLTDSRTPPKSPSQPDSNHLIHLPNLKQDRLGTFDFISWWERNTVTNASVMVIGAGALGNEVLKNLALMGIGKLFIVDFDDIEAANLSRSILFREEDNGQPKAETAARRLKQLNPDIRVQYFHGNVITDLGLGVFRRVDGIVGCLDNREARLAVNRFSHWLGKPWVDGAIQELLGLVQVFVPGQGACYECTLTEQARREMSLRYSCPLLARHNILLGKVPTTPTISSIIGAMQSQEILKLLHRMPVEAGKTTHFNGLTNEMYTSGHLVREDCESHWTYSEITERADLTAGSTTLAQLLTVVRGDLGAEAVLELDHEIVLGLECPYCHAYAEVFRPLVQVNLEDGLCPNCHQLRQVHMTHVITGDEKFLNRTLHSIGIPPLHVIRAHNAIQYRFYELTGDLKETLHFDHFSEDGNPSLTIRRPKSRIKLGRAIDEPAQEGRRRIRLKD